MARNYGKKSIDSGGGVASSTTTNTSGGGGMRIHDDNQSPKASPLPHPTTD